MLKMLTCLHNNSEFQLNRLTQKIAFKCLEIKLAYFKVEKEVVTDHHPVIEANYNSVISRYAFQYMKFLIPAV